MAASASHQFVVEKEVVGGRTQSWLFPVEGAERVKELARMLGGQTDSALAHAKALLAKKG